MNKFYLFIFCYILFSLDIHSRAQSPYISRVFEYKPAPGQFVNQLPEYEEGDTPEEMALKAEESIEGTTKVLVTLGGYGGYIVFGFDHLVVNVPNEYDFKVWGNAFYANANPNPDASKEGGSCEPGIVMVSYDTNKNGLPDDEWYELAGSEYTKPKTIKNYKIVYSKPDEDKVKTPNKEYPALNDTTYIRWTSNQGTKGYISRNIYHSQPYYPMWINEESMTFEGTKLADNYVDESGTGSYYVQYAYPWGYADNHPNTDVRSGFKIEWAVDKFGNKVELPGIHFVKVYTGVNQYCGWLGETSTEIMGAEDLHIDAITSTKTLPDDPLVKLLNNPVIGEQIKIASSVNTSVEIFNIQGIKVLSCQIYSGVNYINCNTLSKGLYLLVSQKHTVKFIRQ